MKHPLESHQFTVTARLTDPELIAAFDKFRSEQKGSFQIDTNTYLMGSETLTANGVIEHFQPFFLGRVKDADNEIFVSGTPAGVVRIA